MDLLACPVCLDTYEDPVMLTGCGHSFCDRCARLMGAGPGEARCPICRTGFRPADLQPNFAVRQLLAERAIAPAAVARAEPAHRQADPDPGRVQRLQGKGVPFGLAKLLDEEDRRIGLRIFLLDNSVSTEAHDGRYYERQEDGSLQCVACTRWEEITRMAEEQAAWNLLLGTPCEFYLLNPGPGPVQEGRDIVRFRAGGARAAESMASLRGMLKQRPRGVTPLNERLSEIYTRVEAQHADLVAENQQVVLVIATDGLPTPAYAARSSACERRAMAETLKRLGTVLSVFTVIRLATDDRAVVEYYHSLDGEAELPLEVIDDHESEAREIQRRGNGWLAYSPLLHTIREGGSFVKLLDFLNERQLTGVEIAVLSQMLLRGEGDAPWPRPMEELCATMEQVVNQASLVYNPISDRMEPPVRVAEAISMMLPLKARAKRKASAIMTKIASEFGFQNFRTCKRRRL